MMPKKGGKGAVRGAIEDAKPVTSAKPAEQPSAAPSWMAKAYEMRPDGLFRRGKEQDDAATWLAAPFTIEAETRDSEGRNWGFLISWHDRDGVLHRETFPRSMFIGECLELRNRLADGGLTLGASPAARQALATYLNVIQCSERARCVSRTGWHNVGPGRVFVLPDRSFGSSAEHVVLQTTDREPSLFNTAGTLAEWRDEVSKLCIGNSRLILAASCAFGAPLLGLLGEDGGGFNLRGGSRLGKSTALRLAASVCGGLPGHGAAGFVRQWRATGNGLESVASSHSDCLLPLDELAQVDAREAAEIAYMLANGQGKSRAGRQGGGKPAGRWRVLILSTGEISLSDKNAEAGRAIKAGAEVRLADVPADAGCGLGIFENLHGRSNADAFARELSRVTAARYGTALPAYLQWLVNEMRANAGGLVERIRGMVESQLRGWLFNRPEAGGQTRSVGFRFSTVGVAGELATEAGVTGWPAGAAAAGAEACFQDWLGQRGTAGAAEDLQAARQLRAFVSAHGMSRFDIWTDATSEGQSPECEMPPIERFRTQNRAGWRRWQSTAGGRPVWRFYLTADGLKEALSGLALQESKKTLVAKNLILPSRATADLAKNIISAIHTVPGHGKARLYELAPDILNSEEG